MYKRNHKFAPDQNNATTLIVYLFKIIAMVNFIQSFLCCGISSRSVVTMLFCFLISYFYCSVRWLWGYFLADRFQRYGSTTESCRKNILMMFCYSFQTLNPADKIYVVGCLKAGEGWFNDNLIPVAGVVVAIALIQVMWHCHAKGKIVEIYGVGVNVFRWLWQCVSFY